MDKANILKNLKTGKIKLYQIEKFVSPQKAIDIRRKYLEELMQKKLNPVSEYVFDPEQIYGRNCENVIGGTSIPVGLVGPIMVRGENANGEYFVPIATTEGALVASINRGSKVVSQAGGVNVISEYVGITRAPLYRLKGIKDAHRFTVWVNKNFKTIKKIGDSTDRHISLQKITPHTNGKNVWLRMSFDTKDAMGMNMAVIATHTISNWMEKKYKGLKTIAISGNMCVDKKPALINTIQGRGRIVEAEVTIPAKLIEQNLRSKVDEIIEVNKNKIWLGGEMAGAVGFNAHVANMTAGVFIATGQDPAQVVGTSLASTNMEKQGKDLYMHVRIPAMNVATVGGGTGLSTQKECLEILLKNISKKLKEGQKINKTQKLAEIIGAIVLAGELSLHAAFASNTFVKAHKDFGRNRKARKL